MKSRGMDGQPELRFADLFCGIGGFRVAMREACREAGVAERCVLSSDIDPHCREIYQANFGERPLGDIRQVDARSVPDHDILFAGFPCQPFSIIGQRRGFDDIRGTLFFDIARILREKRPRAFVLENVKQLAGHQGGRTLRVILETLSDLGYHTRHAVLNALDYGLPQKRERIIIVGSRDDIGYAFPPPARPYRPLAEILEPEPDRRHYVSERIARKRAERHTAACSPAIWHENKSGNVASYPYSCALRAAASYNYLLVDGVRRLTPREMFRLQGFPDDYRIVVSDCQARRQAGNSVPVNMIKAVISSLLPHLLPPA